MYQNKTVSVVMATYGEKDSVRSVIDGFFNTGLVDEVIVVNNNAEPGTDEEVKKTKAIRLYETRQGQGFTFRRGIKEASGDYVILCEPDNTFVPKDLERFLVYAKDFDVVFGSRTNWSTLDRNTEMYPLRRLANRLSAKMFEILYQTNTISDVACTFKLLRKETLRKIEPYFVNGNSLFATETLLRIIGDKSIKFVEIPVSFKKRSGPSTVVQNFRKMAYWGIKVNWYAIKFRFQLMGEKIFKKT